MFKRPHHQSIAKLLQAFDGELLQRANCYFGGGTAIVLALDEYRESVDIDFMCSDLAGYRILRNAITAPTLGSVLRVPVKHRRDVKTERDKISTFLEVDAIPVKIEFVLEGRISLIGALDAKLGVPVLSRDDMYAEKLLANVDRGLDRSVMNRDLIDLAMMMKAWGGVPASALEKARKAYGDAVDSYFIKTVAMLGNRQYLADCLHKMAMDPTLAEAITDTLRKHPLKSAHAPPM